MRPTQSVGQLAVALLSLSPAVSAALSWPRWLPELDSLVVRQASTTTAAPAATATNSASSATTSTKKNAPITTNLNTGGITQSPTGTGSSSFASGTMSGNSSSTKDHTMYDPMSPAGSVVMITPATTEGTQLYKIGDYVTWGWNYTNVLGTPTAIDVLVSCSVASATWTLTQNMTWETLGSYTWDTGAYQSTAVASPLLVEQYTLIIYDADSAITATAEAGYLSPYSGFVFGLYTPQPYTPLGEWKCATCSAAVSDMEKRALGAVVAMSVVTVLSFTWFVTGFGAFL